LFLQQPLFSLWWPAASGPGPASAAMGVPLLSAEMAGDHWGLASSPSLKSHACPLHSQRDRRHGKETTACWYRTHTHTTDPRIGENRSLRLPSKQGLASYQSLLMSACRADASCSILCDQASWPCLLANACAMATTPFPTGGNPEYLCCTCASPCACPAPNPLPCTTSGSCFPSCTGPAFACLCFDPCCSALVYGSASPSGPAGASAAFAALFSPVMRLPLPEALLVPAPEAATGLPLADADCTDLPQNELLLPGSALTGPGFRPGQEESTTK
jgi:hypothetical protein